MNLDPQTQVRIESTPGFTMPNVAERNGYRQAQAENAAT
jgi:hypothetical protein